MSARTVYTCDRCKHDIGNDARYALRLAFIEQPESMDPVPAALELDLCGYCAGQIRPALATAGRVVVEIPDPAAQPGVGE